MTKLSSLVDQTKLKNEMGVMKKAKKAIMEDERLLELFLISCKDNEHLEEEDDKKKMYCRLVDKVANARWQDDIRALNQSHTVRGSKKHTTKMATRADFKARVGFQGGARQMKAI
jgi:hypothetical protein